MTTRQKTLITATLVAAVGVGIYEARQAATLRTEMELLRQQEVPLAQQTEQLTRERDVATRQLAPLRATNELLTRSNSELPKLRGEISRLRREAQELVQLKATVEAMSDSPKQWVNRAEQLKQLVEQRPHLKIPEFQFLTDEDWRRYGDPGTIMTTEDGIRSAMGFLRATAKSHFFPSIVVALDHFIMANNGQLPSDILQLKPYFNSPVEEAMLQRYKLLHTGKLSDYSESEPLLTEKAPVDDEYDMISSATAYGGSSRGIGKMTGNGGSWTMPTNLTAQLKPFAR